jgi:hypothetical protein
MVTCTSVCEGDFGHRLGGSVVVGPGPVTLPGRFCSLLRGESFFGLAMYLRPARVSFWDAMKGGGSEMLAVWTPVSSEGVSTLPVFGFWVSV